MNKGAQEGRRAGRPGFAGRDRTRQAARRQGPPAGLPPLALALSAVAAGAAAGRGRPSLSRAAHAGEESRARRRRCPPALPARPLGLRAPPARAARAARRPHSPGWRWLPDVPGRWGGRGDASKARAEAEGEAGGRRTEGGAGPVGGGGGSGSSHSRQIASRPLSASGKGRRRGRLGDLPSPSARLASVLPRARPGNSGAATQPAREGGGAGSPTGAGDWGLGEEGASDAIRRTPLSSPPAELPAPKPTGSVGLWKNWA